MSKDTYKGVLASEKSSEPMVVHHYLFILRKHLRPIALFAAVVTCIAALYAFTATPVYRATATLLLEEQSANLVSIDELYGVDSDRDDYFETQFQTLRSRALAHRVIERLDLWQDPELNKKTGSLTDTDTTDAGANDSVRPVEQESTISAFLNRLNVSPVSKTKFVKINYESSDPTVATRIANAVGEEYIQGFLEEKLALTATASDWLDDKLLELKSDVDKAEERLISFRRDNDLVDIQGGVARLNEQQLLLDTTELAQARSQLNAERNLLDDVRELQGNTDLLEAIPDVRIDPLVQRTKIEQANVQRELDELLTRYGERHPRVLDKKSELASLAGSLERNIGRVAATIEKRFQLAQQRVFALNAKLNGDRADIQLIGDKKFEHDALQFELDTRRSVYDQYFNRRAEYASTDGLEAANARISDRARLSASPVKPKKALIIAAALFGSLLLGVLAAFLREALDDTVKGTDDVESKLALRLLGILPLVKSGIVRKNPTLPLSPETVPDARSTFSEAVNTVRTALTLNDGNPARKVIVVTSSVRGEGKSTSAINIAHSLGQIERVLLIDCDMRRPSIAKAAGLRATDKGLSNLIAQTATAEDCFRLGQFGGHVDVLPCGPIPDKPLELLSSKRFGKIIEQASQHYDRVILDTAPTQAVSDALIISQFADSVVYVVKSHETSINLVRRGITRLQRAGAAIEGILMTQVDIDKVTAYCGNYDVEGYHDAYDIYEYSDDGEKLRSRFKLSRKELMDIRDDNVKAA